MKNNKFSTDSRSQRGRLLEYLIAFHTITTLQARQELDIMNPSARIQELKAEGHNIVSHRTVDDSGKAKHSGVAIYALLSGGRYE